MLTGTRFFFAHSARQARRSSPAFTREAGHACKPPLPYVPNRNTTRPAHPFLTRALCLFFVFPPEVTIRQTMQLPPAGKPSLAAINLSPASTPLRVLPTMTLRTFRLKLAKALKFKLSRTQTEEMRLWLVMPDSSLGEITSERETDDLSWWGVEDGSEIVLYVPS